MIPLFAAIRMEGRGKLQLLLPLFLFWILFLPLLLLALPLLLLLALLMPVRIWRGSRAYLSLLSAIRGTRVEMSAPGQSLIVHVW
jgi:hypothetical protein